MLTYIYETSPLILIKKVYMKYNFGDKVLCKDKVSYKIIAEYHGDGVIIPSEKDYKNPKMYLAISYAIIQGTEFTFINGRQMDIIKTKDIKKVYDTTRI